MNALPRFSLALALTPPLIGVAAVQTVDAAGYLKIGDIKGESIDQAHEEWIEIESFSWGIRCEPSSDGTVAPEVKPVIITKYIDKSSPILMLACGVGGAIPEATIALTLDGRNEGRDYYKVTFHDVLVSSFTSGPNSVDEPPTESISLNYAKVTWTYYPADGSEPVVVSRELKPDPTAE